jgi:hypothetical protein
MAADFNQERAFKFLDSMFQISLAGFKLLALLNGGAAVALLAYLGNIAGKKTASAVAVVSLDFRLPMALFILGLVFCAGAYGFSYATQYSLWEEAVNAKTPGRHMRWFYASLTMCVLSVSAFMVGSFLAAQRFQLLM